MKTLLSLIAGLLLAVSGAQAQSDFSTLEERMTGDEFRDTGLDKLSDEELRNLNDWIRSNLNVEAVSDLETRQQIRRQVEEEVRAEQEGERTEFTATVPGHFTGWTGNTVFELANGQIWRQVSGGTYRVSMEDPTVVIYPGAFDSWRLRLEDAGPSIGVKRVK